MNRNLQMSMDCVEKAKRLSGENAIENIALVEDGLWNTNKCMDEVIKQQEAIIDMQKKNTIIDDNTFAMMVSLKSDIESLKRSIKELEKR